MHLLLPFANSQSPDCQAALKSLALPNLDKLLRKLPIAHKDAALETTLSPPHERALAAACGIVAPDGQIPFGAYHATQVGHRVLPGEAWAIITTRSPRRIPSATNGSLPRTSGEPRS